MRLSARCRYAVMALTHLAREESAGCADPVSIADIAARQQLPLAYLEQLFAQLRRAGLVESTRGATGGYRLARGAAGTRVADILAAVDANLGVARCNLIPAATPPDEHCPTRALWEALGEHISGFLCAVTLEDVVRGTVKKRRIDA